MTENTTNKGLIVTPPTLAQSVIDGEATMIIRPYAFDCPPGEYVLVSMRKALGIVNVGERCELDQDGFAESETEHLVTKQMRDEWAEVQPSWAGERLWGWPVDVVEKFDEPLETDVEPGFEMIVQKVVLLDVEKKRLALWGSTAGKTRVASRVVSMIPEHKTYVEPFAGGAAVFYAKEPSEKEVLCDINPEIPFCFKYIKDITSDEIEKIKKFNWVVTREQAKKVHEIEPKTDAERFYRFAYKRYALFYRNETRITGIDPGKDGKRATIPDRIEQTKERLKGVVIKQGDYRAVIDKYDSPDTFFYFDPPYPERNQEVGEKEFDDDAFLEKLKGLKGKFILHHDEKARKKYAAVKGWTVRIISVTRTAGHTQGVAPGKLLEVLNYEPSVTKLDDGWEIEDWNFDDELIEADTNKSELLFTANDLIVATYELAHKNLHRMYAQKTINDESVPMSTTDITNLHAKIVDELETQYYVGHPSPPDNGLDEVSEDFERYSVLTKIWEEKAVWSRAYINRLPDSAFLYIESGGEKDDEDKTVPRSLRHFPYKDASGKVDLPHLRNAIARLPQSKLGLSAERIKELQDKARHILEEETEDKETQKRKSTAALLVECGPPDEWSGGVASVLGEEGRKRITELWNELSQEDKKKVLDAFNEMFDAQDVIFELEEDYEDVAKFDIEKQSSNYLDVPKEEKRCRFVVQMHYRGKSMHSDIRLESEPNGTLYGWTLNTQKADAIKEPVTTMAQARAFSGKTGEISKVNWNTGQWSGQILSERKPLHPNAWLDVEGKTKDPEPGMPSPVGGTAQYPGVFDIVDQGSVEYGAQKSGFHEYFFHGKNLRSRIVFKKTDADTWLSDQPENQCPYVLGDTAKSEGWMPPYGISALPKAIKDKIPEQFWYWEKSGAEAKALRDDLTKAIKAGEVDIDCSEPFKKILNKSKTNADFVLQKQTDTIDGTETWWARFDIGEPEIVVFKWDRYPVCDDPIAVSISRDRHKESINASGRIGAGHYLNTEKRGPLEIEIVDQGKANVVFDSDNTTIVEIKGDDSNGDQWNGVYQLTKNSDGWVWAPGDEYSKMAIVGKRFEFEMYIPFDHIEIQKKGRQEKRLVTGIVLEPDQVDAQQDWEKEETIEKAAHDFLMKYNKSPNEDGTKLGLMHQSFGDIGIELVESWVAPIAFNLGNRAERHVKKGSWLMTVHVSSDKTWRDVKDGKITGFSIGGVATVAND
jgi:site-specific DNA-adenine methylase